VATVILAWSTVAATFLTLLLLIPFAAHRLRLLRLAAGARPTPEAKWEGPLPRVTVQLPVYNEAGVVERLLDAVASLDHPRELLEIQLLDDSTDETRERAARRVQRWRERGVRVRHIRRPDRSGYKAGALARGLAEAEGELLLILDADFVPEPDLIRRLLPHFQDPGVGMVQARWDHLNEEASLLTRCQALLLDGHFFFEQGGRHAAGRFMNFNGTAGMWRRQALEEAGGWSSDTLTEDLDVSYRAQMAGWRFVFLPGVGVPSEIPESIRALEVQQARWSQGGVQTGKKLLPALLRGPWSKGVKMEAVVHLMGHLAYPLTLLLGVLILPSALARRYLGLDEFLILDLLVFAGATLSFLVFYVAAGRRRSRPFLRLVPTAVTTLALGIGLTASVSRAVVRGLRGGERDPFHRTPKKGGGPLLYRSPARVRDTVLKLILAGWMLVGTLVALHQGILTSVPFLVLFGAGYAWLGVGELVQSRAPVEDRSEPVERLKPVKASA
jgi:cellulose synthase/poly-beta-1,6-N-acetylglucosamine synthase-like glycosyltransferase